MGFTTNRQLSARKLLLFAQRHGDSAYFCDKLHVIELHVDN